MGTIETDIAEISLPDALRQARIAAGFKTAQAAADVSSFREKDFYRWESVTNLVVPSGAVIIELYKLYYPHLDLLRIRLEGRYLLGDPGEAHLYGG